MRVCRLLNSGSFLGVMTAIFAMLLVVPIWMFIDISSTGEPFRRHADEVTVINSKIRFDEDDSSSLVVVAGRIRNASPRTWNKARLQVEFLNAKGELFDAGQESEYRSPSLPAGQEVAFEASFRRQFPEEEYAAHRVRVISASDATARFFFR